MVIKIRIHGLPPVKQSKRFLTRNTANTSPFVTQLRQMDLILLKDGTKSTSEWRPPLPQRTTTKARMDKMPTPRKKTCEDVIRFIERPNNEPALSIYTSPALPPKWVFRSEQSLQSLIGLKQYKWQVTDCSFHSLEAPTNRDELAAVIAQSLWCEFTCVGCFNHTYLTLINID